MIALAAAWALSVLALVGDPAPLDGASRTALALFVWLALAGLPTGSRSRATRETPDTNGAALAVALMAVPLALAWRLDRGAGVDVPWGLVAYGIASVAALRLAADVAAERPRAAARHGAIWIALVVAVPVLAAILAGGEEGAPAWIRTIAAASPLAWALERAVEPDASPPWAPLGVCLLLVGVGLAPGGEGDA